MRIQRDGKGQPFIEWEQAPGGYKRAWVRKPTTKDADWANTGRYINVVRVDGFNVGLGGHATDFPIFNDALSDEQVLIAFVTAVCAITGCPITQPELEITA